MMSFRTCWAVWGLVAVCTASVGCTAGVKRWWNNGLKLGPNYQTPSPEHAASWLDRGEAALGAGDTRVQQQWWQAFEDPVLSELVVATYQQNLSVKAAFLRIEAARLQRDIAVGEFFPQSQSVTASYARQQANDNFSSNWGVGGSLSWELDLWGRLRRSIAAADANVQASQADANAIIVSLISEVATVYIQIRSFDERIAVARRNVAIQEASYAIASKKNKILEAKIDERQALSNLEDTRALIPELERQRRNTIHQLAVLLGTTSDRMREWVSAAGSLPQVPAQLLVNVPCEVIRQRPDIQVAERSLAIQAEQIGIAQADLYPRLSVGGSISFQADAVSGLFTPASTVGSVGPSFQWNILNYGRITSNVRLQENLYQQALVAYREAALLAQQEVEDGIVDFLKFSEQLKHQEISAQASAETVVLGQKRYQAGKASFSSVFVYESDLVTKSDAVIQTKANIALALIQTYTAFGGGWQIRSSHPLAGEISVPAAQDRSEIPGAATPSADGPTSTPGAFSQEQEQEPPSARERADD